jgi:hypothetical protein
VGPPAVMVTLQRNTMNFITTISPLKLKTQVLHSLAKRKWKNRAKIIFSFNTLLLSYRMTTMVVFIRFADQVVDHWRFEPLLKTTNYINGALIAETERANNHPA